MLFSFAFAYDSIQPKMILPLIFFSCVDLKLILVCLSLKHLLFKRDCLFNDSVNMGETTFENNCLLLHLLIKTFVLLSWISLTRKREIFSQNIYFY